MTVSDPVGSILERLTTVPRDVDASLVVRHAEREEIPEGTFGYDVSLTAQGVRAAERLGAALSDRRTINAVSSPVPRCVHTARAILRGAGLSSEVATERRLGDPGAFVLDPEISGPLFLELPIPEIARRQLQDTAPLPGMRPTAWGVEIMLGLTTGSLGRKGRLTVYVTHDVILAVLVASIFQSPLEEIGWPGYLEGLLSWRSASGVSALLAGTTAGSLLATQRSGKWPDQEGIVGHIRAPVGPSRC